MLMNKTATSSFFSEWTKHPEAIALISPMLGKPSTTVPPLRLTSFIVRISIFGEEEYDNISTIASFL
jgi:hypothetical protein